MIGLVTGNLNFGDKAISTRILSDTHQVLFRHRERDIDRRRLGNRHHRRRRVWLNQVTGGHRAIAGLAGDRSANLSGKARRLSSLPAPEQKLLIAVLLQPEIEWRLLRVVPHCRLLSTQSARPAA